MVQLNKRKWRKWHKWVSLMVGVPLLLLCLSGVILNHRPFFSDMDVSRGILPDDYRFRNWNNGLLKGTCSLDSNYVLIYGKAGVWKMNLQTQEITDFNDGFPKGVDHRTISRVVQTKDSVLYAAAQFSLYRKEKSKSWERVSVSDDEGNERTIPFDDTRLTDIALKGDSVVLTSRSHVYIYHPQTSKAEELVLASPEGKEPSVSLFRICWKLHSGEMFGMVGKLLVDILAMVFVFLFVTGMIVWFWPKRIRRADKASLNKPRLIKQLKWNGVWHDKVGRLTIVLTLFVAVTGWFLRPPLLVLIANSEVGLLGTPENVWEDKLRALQYDERMDDWLLYTSDGFFSMKGLDAIPVLTECQPPVSVMGVNVLCCEYPPAEYSAEKRWEQQVWMVGSFAGLYAWHRPSGQVYDVINGITLPPRPQALPFGNVKVSGYSNDVFPSVLCSYDEGVITGHVSRPHPLPQPDTMAELPMSLWNLALEIHTGRIFTFLGVFSTLLYIFVVGIMVLILLGSGWVIRRSKSLSIRCLFGRPIFPFYKDYVRFQKENLRNKIINKLKSQDSESIRKSSELIIRNLMNNTHFRDAEVVLLYHSLSFEVNTHRLIEQIATSKIILLPETNKSGIRLRRYQPDRNLRKGIMDIMEPTGDYFEDYKKINVAVIPGIAFDRYGNRLGHGKGYYDKLLAQLSNVYKIGLCFNFQFVEELPVAENDIKMDIILTTDQK